MRALSLAEQDRLIRQQWPEMRTVFLSSTFGRWRGTIFGFSRQYEIMITYVTDRRQANFIWNYAAFPVVEVVSPRLERREEDPDRPIPHLYEELLRRVLCLFDPLEKGWSSDRPIAETTVPWTADWLRHYEIWQATGEWKGGGRDHVVRDWDLSAISYSPRLSTKVSKVTGLETAVGAFAESLLASTGGFLAEESPDSIAEGFDPRNVSRAA